MSGFWTTISNMPTPNRRGLATCNIGTKVYATAGYSTASSSEPSLLEWDQTTNTWTTKSPIPAAVRFSGGEAIGSKFYVVGGYDTSSVAQAAMYEWNQATDTWTTKAPLPSPRSNLAVCSMGTKLYVLGGIDATSTTQATLFEWDQATNSWTTKSSFPYTITDTSMGSVGASLYVFGGSYNGNSSTNTIYEWNSLTDTWTLKSATLSAVSQGGEAAAIDTILIHVPSNAAGSAFGTTRAFSYDTTTNSASSLNNRPNSRLQPHTFGISGVAYVLSEGVNNNVNDIVSSRITRPDPSPAGGPGQTYIGVNKVWKQSKRV